MAEPHGTKTCGGYYEAENRSRVFRGICASIKAILRVKPERCGEYEQNEGENGFDSKQSEPPKH